MLKALGGMASGHPDFATLHGRLVNFQETDMAVVVSPGQNAISEILPILSDWSPSARCG